MYRSNTLKTSLATKFLEVYQEDKLLDLHSVLLAIDNNSHRLHRMGNTLGRTARGENIIKKRNLENISLGNSCTNVATTLVERVETILLLDAHFDKVAFVEGEFATLTYRDNILHLFACQL